MFLLLIALLVLVVMASKPSKNILFQSYISVPQTQSLKGLFVITIFLNHFCPYIQVDSLCDQVVWKYCRFLGQSMVVPFLFYSGYGIFESAKKKGMSYISAFPKKRIFKVLIHFDLAVILFLMLDFVIEKPVTPAEFLLSLVGWESIGNSNWFIFAILCAYTIAFVGLSIFKCDLKKAFYFILFFTLVYMVVMFQFKEIRWYDTIITFPLGCALSLYKEKFERYICRRNIMIVLGLSVFAYIFAKFGYIPYHSVNRMIAPFVFTFILVFLSFYIHFESKILSWFGTQVFGIYILQRLPMNLGKYLHWDELNEHFYFVFCFIVTLLLAIAFKRVTDFIDSKVL